VYGGEWLGYCRDAIAEYFDGIRQIAFVPFALHDHQAYTEFVQDGFRPFGIEIVSYEHLASVEAVFVGGGNSFRLLKGLQDRNLIDPIQTRTKQGTLKYMGVSAGTNMACPTLRTTNDMPIVQPRSFDAIGLVPLQINPHYVESDPNVQHMGETRDVRINEFLEENDVHVLGLREGAWLHRSGDALTLSGIANARHFRRNAQPVEYTPGTDLSWLLQERPRYDS
jgi:dipeptidase E